MVKNPSANAGDADSIPESGKSPGERKGNPLQYSCLGNPTDRGSQWTTVPGVAKESDKTYRLNNNKRWKMIKEKNEEQPTWGEDAQKIPYLAILHRLTFCW